MGISNSYGWLNKNSLILSCIFGLLSFIALIIIKINASLSYIPDISGSETSTILPIQSLISGQPIYTDPQKPPFRLTQYTPVYFSIVAFFFKFTGWKATDVHMVFLASRSFSMLFTFGSVLLAGLLIYRLTNRNAIIATLSALFIYHILALWILTSSRPDSLVVLLTSVYLIAVYKALTAEKSTQKWWYLAIFIAVTAFFVKQSGAIHSIALGVYCIFNKQWKLLFRIIAAGILTFLLYLLILPVNTLSLFFANIIGGVSNSISWDWFYHWTMEKWVLQFVAIIAMNLIISTYHFSKKPAPYYIFLSVSSGLFFLFATLTSLKIGAGVGYYQDYMIIAVVQIAVFLADEAQANKFGGKFSRIGLSLYLVFVYLHCTFFVFMSYKSGTGTLYLNKYINQRKVAEYLYNEKKLGKKDWVLIDSGSNYTGYYMRHFLFPHILIPFTDIVFLADKNKTFQYDVFKKMVDGGKIRYVITDHGKYPQNILNYSFSNTLNYSSTIGWYDIYESNTIAN